MYDKKLSTVSGLESGAEHSARDGVLQSYSEMFHQQPMQARDNAWANYSYCLANGYFHYWREEGTP